MNLKTIMSVMLGVCLLSASFGVIAMDADNPDSPLKTEINVITESDAGGGDVTGRDIALIALVAVGTFFLLLLFFITIFPPP